MGKSYFYLFSFAHFMAFAVSFPKGESTLTENLDGNVFLTKIMANVFCDHSDVWHIPDFSKTRIIG